MHGQDLVKARTIEREFCVRAVNPDLSTTRVQNSMA
jgi:hypothetical protein